MCASQKIHNTQKRDTRTCVRLGQPPLPAGIIPSSQVPPTVERRSLKVLPNGDPSGALISRSGEEMQSALSERKVLNHMRKQSADRWRWAIADNDI